MVRPASILACGVAAVALTVSACAAQPESASSGAQPSPMFSGGNATFCGDLLAANEHSAAAEAAKTAGDPASVQSNATAMHAALQDALDNVPEGSKDVKKALKKYVAQLERALAGEELGDQAQAKVKKTTKTISEYYDDKCRVAG